MKYIRICLSILILFVIVYVAGRFGIRIVAKWIMPYPEYFQKYAGDGLAAKEAREFKLLNDRFGIPDNPCTIVDTQSIGVWVYYPLTNNLDIGNLDLALALVLNKKISDKKIFFVAMLCSTNEYGLPDRGNPEISMNIPLDELGDIISNGVDREIIEQFIRVAKSNNWQLVGDKTYDPLPGISLPYRKR